MKPRQQPQASSDRRPDVARRQFSDATSQSPIQRKQPNPGSDSDSPHDPASFSLDGELASAVLETVGAVVTVLDGEGRIVQFNQACETLTGYRFEEVRGCTVWDFLVPPSEIDAVREVYHCMKAGHFPNRDEHHWVT